MHIFTHSITHIVFTRRHAGFANRTENLLFHVLWQRFSVLVPSSPLRGSVVKGIFVSRDKKATNGASDIFFDIQKHRWLHVTRRKS